MLVPQKLCGKLCPGLVHAGPGAAIDSMYLHDHQDVGASGDCETEGDYQEQQPNNNAPGIALEL